MLLERDTELRAVETRLGAVVDGEGAVLIVEGPPGIGKTSILRAVLERAEARGFDVLRARGTPLERSFPFGVARQLLERRLVDSSDAERDAILGGAADGAPAALGIGPADAETDQGLRGLHSLYWLAANLAGRRPLALVVDDAHWADRPSLRWLAYLADRLAGVPLLLVVATRDAEPGAEQDLLDTLAAGEAATVLRPRTLSGDAVDALVADGFGRDAEPAFSAACGRATGGNPLLLGELVRELAGEGVEPTDAGAATVLDFGADGVARTVRRRLAALRAEAARVAECVAVVGDDEPLGLIAAVAELDEAVVREVCGELIATDVFAKAQRPAFVHPLVRAAVHRALAPPLRDALHDRAARVIAGEDGVAAERVAVHLVHAEPAGDPWVVATLLDAASDAARRGAPDIAAGFARRALAEPPADVASRGRVLQVLGTAEATMLSGDYEAHLRAAGELTDDPSVAGECALTLGRAKLTSWDVLGAIAALEPALAAAPPGSEIAIRLEADLLGFALSATQLRPRVASITTRRLAQIEAGEPLDPRIAGPLSGLLVDHPPTRRATELARAAITDPVFLRDLEAIAWNQTFHALMAGGAYADAAALARAVSADARRRGAAGMVGWGASATAEPLHRMGDVIEAEAAVLSGLEHFPSFRTDRESRVLAASVAGPVLVSRGAFTLAEELFTDMPDCVGSRHHIYAWAHEARGELRLAQGRLGDAIADLRASAAAFEPGEFPSPHQSRWRGPLALALAETGEPEEARALASTALEDARRYEVPVHVGTALSVSGSVTGGPDGIAQLREGVAILAGTEGRLEHARAVVRLGKALGGEEGREHLRTGLDLAARFGATPLADEAHQALVAAGGRPRRERRFISGPESLTAGEFRVARLVAEGLSNREVAQQLFVTQAAVQFHLRGVFRKLDISARTQLPAALSGEPSPAAAKD